jgi:hypothetical protein
MRLKGGRRKQWLQLAPGNRQSAVEIFWHFPLRRSATVFHLKSSVSMIAGAGIALFTVVEPTDEDVASFCPLNRFIQ